MTYPRKTCSQNHARAIEWDWVNLFHFLILVVASLESLNIAEADFFWQFLHTRMPIPWLKPCHFFSWSDVDILVFLCRNQAYNSKWERRCEKRHFLYRNFKFFVKCLRMKQARSFALRVQFWLFSGLCAKVCSYQAEKISFPLWDFEKRIRSCGCLFFLFFLMYHW